MCICYAIAQFCTYRRLCFSVLLLRSFLCFALCIPTAHDFLFLVIDVLLISPTLFQDFRLLCASCSYRMYCRLLI